MLHLDVEFLQAFVLSGYPGSLIQTSLLRGLKFVELSEQRLSLFEEWFKFAAVFGPDIVKAVSQ